MDLEEIFATPLQVRLLKIFLENPDKLFSTRTIAKLANSSPSAIISRLKFLAQMNIINVLEINRLRLYSLNKESPISKILLDFFQKIKKLNIEVREKIKENSNS